MALWVEVYVRLFVGTSSPADDVITCPLPGTHSLASAVAVSCRPRSDALPMLPYVTLMNEKKKVPVPWQKPQALARLNAK